MADQRISQLTPLTGALNVADALPISDDSASLTKKISPKVLLEQAFQLADDNSLPASKISGAAVPAGSIGTSELADAAVTAIKLADGSSVIVSGTQPSASFVGQGWLDTSSNKTYFWNGNSWLAAKAAGSINSITYTNSDPAVALSGVQTGDSLAVDVVLSDTTGARQFLAGPTGTGGDVTARQIIGADLPAATTTELGAVVVGAGDGLAVTAGSLSIDNTVVANTADTLHLVQYNSHGLVVGGRQIVGTDIPIATVNGVGGVIPGTGLTITPEGYLNHTNNVSPGTGTKVNYDGQGHITSVSNLLPEDLPTIPGSQVSGGIVGANLVDRSVAEIKLADYSTCLIQEGLPSGDYKLGQMWFTPSTSQLRVYGRGSGQQDLWLSVGFGALQTQNLRWGGTINADTSTIVSLTDIGTSAGLTAGGAIPTPTDELSGLYFVVAVAGDNIDVPNVTGLTFTEADWLLYIDQAQGAIRLDISAGGGGGGGASQLGDLTDVNLTNVEADSLLIYDAMTGNWVNSLSLDGGSY